MQRITGLVLGILGLVAASAVPAQATLLLGGIVNGVMFCTVDNNIGGCGGVQIFDLDPTIGSIQLGEVTLAGVMVEGSTHTQQTGALDVLNSQSLQITNTTGGTISAFLAVGGIDFTAPVTQVQMSGSGVWQNAGGSIANLSFYADPTNQQGGQAFNDLPGQQLFQIADLAQPVADSWASGSVLVPFLANSPFSMTLGLQMNLTAGGSLLSRGQTMIAQPTPTTVPDVSSAGMMLMGSASLLALFRKKLAA